MTYNKKTKTMKDINLLKFDEKEHRYSYDGLELSGITGILKKYIFPDMYADVPQDVLEAAAERGTMIHRQCEDYALHGTVVPFPSDELTAFVNMLSVENINFTAAEMLVTDFYNFASAIDLVDADGNIYDIKTSASVNLEYCAWQLSIYRLLYGITTLKDVKDMYVIHLHGDLARLIKINPVPEEVVEDFLAAVARGDEKWDNPLKNPESIVGVDSVEKLELAIGEMEAGIKRMKQQQQQLMEGIMAEMKKRGIVKFETPRLVFTIKQAYERKSIDGVKLKKEMPQIYENYSKTTIVGESLMIKVKSDEK